MNWIIYTLIALAVAGALVWWLRRGWGDYKARRAHPRIWTVRRPDEPGVEYREGQATDLRAFEWPWEGRVPAQARVLIVEELEDGDGVLLTLGVQKFPRLRLRSGPAEQGATVYGEAHLQDKF